MAAVSQTLVPVGRAPVLDLCILLERPDARFLQARSRQVLTSRAAGRFAQPRGTAEA